MITTQPSFACALGGEDRRTLYCITAPSSEEGEVRTRREGRIEVIGAPAPGAGLP